jgi:transcriptional regulator with XRE-family HTH domain
MPVYTAPMPRELSHPRPAAGARLMKLRKAAGLSQQQLADAIGTAQRNVAYWESIENPPPSDAIPALARVLGVSVETLLAPHTPLPRKGGRVSRLQVLMAEVAELPKRKQDRVLDLLDVAVRQQREERS